MTQPARLQRLTTRYVEAHDRVRLDGEMPNGHALVLWLTQRLLNRLLPHLFQSLERQIPADPSLVASQARAEVLQGFAQQAAWAAIPTQPPVRLDPSPVEWLVQSVDVGFHPQGSVVLTFKTGNHNAIDLALEAVPLRQWLGIVHVLYKNAEWPLHLWPDWIAESHATAPHAQPGATVH